MIFKTAGAFFVLTLLNAGFASAEDSPDQQREKIRKMAASTLTGLYKLQPDSKAAIQKSAGYAVFNNTGTNFLLSTARGAGLAVNSKSKQDTFMKMVSAGVGLGVGVKKYSVVFVFETEPALRKFLDSGWAGETQADAAAKTSKSGGAYSGASMIAPGSPNIRLMVPRRSAAYLFAGFSTAQLKLLASLVSPEPLYQAFWG